MTCLAGLTFVLKVLNSVFMAESGFKVSWIDASVVVEKPKLALYTEGMKDTISKVGINRRSIKAKTNEGIGHIGRSESIAAYAIYIVVPAVRRVSLKADKHLGHD
jgi:2-C-methyl-D-erythritol 2,4-cyclodiphosphate synthase